MKRARQGSPAATIFFDADAAHNQLVALIGRARDEFPATLGPLVAMLEAWLSHRASVSELKRLLVDCQRMGLSSELDATAPARTRNRGSS